MRRVHCAARCLFAFVAAMFTVVAPATAARAAVSCATPSVPMYHVDALAQLRRWDYASPLDGSSGWTEQAIGTGWSGVNIISGGSGVIYVIDASGNLRWYLDNDFNGSGVSWNPASGSVIGTGWNAFRAVVSGGQGVFYAIDAANNVFWYRYLGTNGSFVWDPNSGTRIGIGWSFASTVAGGSGVLYGIASNGTMYWYQEQNPLTGGATWANGGVGRLIGSGWNIFTEIGSAGGGVLFARDTSGSLWWYRDTDPLGGTASWANSGVGVNEGTGWDNSQVVTDILGCVAS